MTDTLHYLEGKYGGKKPYIKLLKCLIELHLGCYAKYQQVDFSTVKRLVFVCKGNISRSPYGQYKALSCNLNAASFGLYAETGKPADSKALTCSDEFNISLKNHTATHISCFKFYAGDLILCFEPAQARYLENHTIPKNTQISLVGLWSNSKRPFVADPYGLHKNYYMTCFTLINEVVENLKPKIK